MKGYCSETVGRRDLRWTACLLMVLAASALLWSQLALAAGPPLDLSGTWKFKADWEENGQALGWQKPEFDDSTWRDLAVPGTWEGQGVTTTNPRWPGSEPYNGYAWYRRHFSVPADWGQPNESLHIGAIDDMDWVYINGQLVGSTSGERAFEQEREYDLKPGLLKPGADNVIAIRILDTAGKGGIVEGPVELVGSAPESAAEEEPGEAAPPPGKYPEKRGDMVQVVGSVTVPPGSQVDGDAVAVGGSVDVKGYVTGDVVAVGGSVTIRPGARVDGDAVAVGGTVKTEGDGIVKGQVTQVTLFPWAIPGIFGLAFLTGSSSLVFVLVKRLILWGLLAVLLALICPKRLQVMARALPLYPGWVAGHGVVGWVLTPAVVLLVALVAAAVCVVLAITIIGIVLIPAVALVLVAVVLGLFLLLCLGLGGVWVSIGQALIARMGRPEASVLPAALLGVVLTAVASAVPVAGTLVLITLVIFAYGLGLMTGGGTRPEWTHRRLGIRRAPEAAPASQTPTA